MADSGSRDADESAGSGFVFGPDRDGDPDRDTADDPADRSDGTSPAEAEPEGRPHEELKAAVEERYDFDDFTPADMAEMSREEWEAVFDEDNWITGTDLLDRVENDLLDRVARRDVFAVIERLDPEEPGPGEGVERVLAYSDTDYAVVYPDGTVVGEGTVLRDVKPVVALCSMPEYEVGEPPEGDPLPDPESVTETSGELGNRLVLTVATVQLLAGLGLLFAPLVIEVPGTGSGLLTTVVGLGFVFVGVVLLLLVANARLSGRFRADEYRERLRAAGVGTDERPEFLKLEEGEGSGEAGR